MNEGHTKNFSVPAPNQKQDPTRRDAIIRAASAILVASTYPTLAISATTKEERKKPYQSVPDPKPVVEEHAFNIGVGAELRVILERNGQHGIGGIAARYFGLEPGSLPSEVMKPNFTAILASLWDKKKKRSPPNKQKMIEDQGIAQSNQYAEERKIGKHRSMSLQEMQGIFHEEIRGLRRSLDWDRLGTEAGILTHIGLMQKLDAHISGRTLTAYALTELFPSDNGSLNVSLFDVLLRSAGANFVTRIPALYDEYLSFGPFQFTQYALFDTPSEKRGASQVSGFLKGRHIPGSVTKLVSLEQHADAAYLFALQGILRLIQAAQGNAEVLKSMKKVGPIALAQYIATAHHAPAPAKTAFLEWIKQGAEGKHSTHFRDNAVGARLKAYTLKTNANFMALRSP